MTHQATPEERLRAENADLRARLEEAEDTLRAIRTGEVDALVVQTADGPQIFTLQGLDAESNRFRGEILAQVSDAVIAVDADQRVTYLNAAAERRYRVSASDVLGHQLSEIYTRHWPHAEAEAAMWAALREHGEWRGEIIHRTHDGRQIAAEKGVTALRDASGAPVGYVSVLHDIRERKQAETKLAQTTQRLKLALRSAPVALFNQDLDLRYTWICNPALGYSPEQVIGKLDSDLFERAQDAASTEAMKREVMRTGARERRDILIHAEGVDRYYDLLVEPLVDKDGSVTGVTCAAIDITERKHSAAELQRVSTLLDTLLRTAPVGFCFLDRDLRCMRINERLAEMNGISAEAHVGRHVSEILPTLVETLRDVTGRILATGEAVLNHEFSGETSSAPGVIRFWNESWYPVRDGAGEVVGFGGIVEDITERKHAEEQLRVAYDSFRHLVEHSPFGVYAVDADFRLVQVSAGAQKVFENVRPLLGRDFAEVLRIVWSEPFASETVAIFRRVLESGEPYHAPSTMDLRQDIGAIESYDWKVERITLPDGRPGAVCHFYDLSERLRYEAQLRDNETHMRLATEATAVGIWERNVHSCALRWDAQMFRIYGIAPTADGSVPYSDWSGAVLPEDLPENERILQETVRDCGHSRREFRIRRREDGEIRDIEAVETVRTNEHGQAEWVLGTNLDITERNAAKESLRRTAEELARSARAKDDFLAALSHELRTPLNPVLMMATALENDPTLTQEVRNQLSMMRRNIELEAQLIDDLLDLTRISRGKLVIDCQATDVHQLLDHTAEIVRSDRLGEDVPIVFTHEAARHHALADGTRIQQVFWNLIKNAVKFTPPGGKITVTTRNDEAGRILISVADTGLGISGEALPNIFNAFEQGDVSGSHRYGGLGLGLAISKAIMDAHGGTLLAESPGPGRGATFTVALESAEAPAPLSPAPATPASPSRGLRLLVVEDHETTRIVLAQLLSNRGHHVTTAGSIQEALAVFAADHFDGIISDLGLPDGSGLDLMQQIQSQRPIPAIALSGYGMEDDLRRTKEAGFFAHLVKPVNLDQLRQLIDQITPSST